MLFVLSPISYSPLPVGGGGTDRGVCRSHYCLVLFKLEYIRRNLAVYIT